MRTPIVSDRRPQMATIADGDVSYGSATKSDSASFVPYDQWGAPTEQQGPTKYTADVRSWGYQAPEKCVEALVRSLLAHALMSLYPHCIPCVGLCLTAGCSRRHRGARWWRDAAAPRRRLVAPCMQRDFTCCNFASITSKGV